MGEADHVLLYLNKSTWSNDDAQRKAALTAEVRTALTERRKLLLVHEEDDDRGGVAFAHFFGGADATPPELLQLKIYAEIAIPMKAGAYRSISLALVERALSSDLKRRRTSPRALQILKGRSQGSSCGNSPVTTRPLPSNDVEIPPVRELPTDGSREAIEELSIGIKLSRLSSLSPLRRLSGPRVSRHPAV